MGFWTKVCNVIAIVMIAGGQPLGQLQKSVAKNRDWKHPVGLTNLNIKIMKNFKIKTEIWSKTNFNYKTECNDQTKN